MESHARGEVHPALLEETIGANLEHTVSAHPESGTFRGRLCRGRHRVRGIGAQAGLPKAPNVRTATPNRHGRGFRLVSIDFQKLATLLDVPLTDGTQNAAS